MFSAHSLVLAPFETLLRLDGIDDVRNDGATHGHGHSLILTHRWLFSASSSAALYRVRCVLSVTDDLTSDLTSLEVLQAA